MLIADDRNVGSGIPPTMCLAEFLRYQNGQIAIQLIEQDTGEHWCTATVAMSRADVPPNCVMVKDYSEGKGMPELLARAGIIDSRPVKRVASGFVEIPVYQLTPAAIAELDKSSESAA